MIPKRMTMPKLFFVAVALINLLIGVSSIGNTEDDVATQEGRGKLRIMQRLSANAGKHVIRLNNSGYSEYIVKKPRPYNVVLLFTMAEGCLPCGVVESNFEVVALSYHNSGAFNEDGEKLPVFFARVDYPKSEKTFRLHLLQSAPHVLFTDHKAFRKMGRDGSLTMRKNDIFTHDQPKKDPAELMTFVNQKSGRSMKVFMSFSDRMTRLLYGIFLLIAAMLCFYLLWSLVLRFPIIIPFGALAVQYVSTSGLFYSLSHSSPWNGWSGKKKVYISDAHRGQFMGEGFLMSFCIIAGGLALLVSVNAPLIEMFRKRKVSDLISLVFFLLSLYCVNTVLDVYQQKSRWYDPTFFPPDDYTMGPINVDQGNTF